MLHHRILPRLWIKLVLAGVFVLSAAIPVGSLAQRGRPAERSDSGGRGESAPRRDPPQREAPPAPRREEPPARREAPPAPRREEPPARREAPPRREESYPRRDPTPRREEPSQRPSDSGSTPDQPRGGGAAPRRDDPPARERGRTPPERGDSGRPSDSSADRAPRSSDRDDNRRNDPFDRDPFDRRNPVRREGPSERTPSESTAGRHPSDRPGTGAELSREYRYSDRTRNRTYQTFVRTAEGRRYANGIILREPAYVASPRLRPYFRTSYYPYYCPAYSVSIAYFSPYSFYYGCFPAYIYRYRCHYRPPAVVYIEVPVYVGYETRGYASDRDDYYLTRDNYRYDPQDRDLDLAIDDIREAYRYGNIDALVGLTDPQLRIAIYRKGKYEYSLDAGDFLDMTRDAMQAMETVQFDLYRIRRRAVGVYTVSGKHVYRNREGELRTVYVSYVLERVNGRWLLTQVGTAPDRIEEPR